MNNKIIFVCALLFFCANAFREFKMQKYSTEPLTAEETDDFMDSWPRERTTANKLLHMLTPEFVRHHNAYMECIDWSHSEIKDEILKTLSKAKQVNTDAKDTIEFLRQAGEHAEETLKFLNKLHVDWAEESDIILQHINGEGYVTKEEIVHTPYIFEGVDGKKYQVDVEGPTTVYEHDLVGFIPDRIVKSHVYDIPKMEDYVPLPKEDVLLDYEKAQLRQEIAGLKAELEEIKAKQKAYDKIDNGQGTTFEFPSSGYKITAMYPSPDWDYDVDVWALMDLIPGQQNASIVLGISHKRDVITRAQDIISLQNHNLYEHLNLNFVNSKCGNESVKLGDTADHLLPYQMVQFSVEYSDYAMAEILKFHKGIRCAELTARAALKQQPDLYDDEEIIKLLTHNMMSARRFNATNGN